jgi:hypothetical protein
MYINILKKTVYKKSLFMIFLLKNARHLKLTMVYLQNYIS